jgi:hypothetical protein
MNSTRKIVYVIFIACLSSVGVVLIVLLNQDFFQETDVKEYKDRTLAEISGAISDGWLPDFLPQSAFDIYEKHNWDYNRGIIAFKFRTAEFKSLASLLIPLSAEKLAGCNPSWLYKNEKWFPKCIVDGKWDRLQEEGFKFYGLGLEHNERIKDRKIQQWFLAINPEKGITYVWY